MATITRSEAQGRIMETLYAFKEIVQEANTKRENISREGQIVCDGLPMLENFLAKKNVESIFFDPLSDAGFSDLFQLITSLATAFSLPTANRMVDIKVGSIESFANDTDHTRSVNYNNATVDENGKNFESDIDKAYWIAAQRKKSNNKNTRARTDVNNSDTVTLFQQRNDDSGSTTEEVTYEPYTVQIGHKTYAQEWRKVTRKVAHNDLPIEASSQASTTSGGIEAARILMGAPGVPDSGPCLFMAYLGVAQTYAGKLFKLKQVQTLIKNNSLYTEKDGAEPGKKVIEAALKKLGIDAVVEVTRTIDVKDYKSDPKAFATVRNVLNRKTGEDGHWQEGTRTGGFYWDPLDGFKDTGRTVYGIRNITIKR